MQERNKAFKATDIDAGSPLWDEVSALYLRAFPPEERVPLVDLDRIARMEEGHLTAFLLDGDLCGFAHWVATDHLVYLAFLAVEEGMRSRGVGAAILGWLRETNPGMPVSLDAETLDGDATNADQRVRRQAFYLRNGFSRTGWRIAGGGVVYDILCTVEDFEPAWEQDAIARTFGPPEGPHLYRAPTDI